MATIVCLGEILLRLSPPHHQRLSQMTALEVQFGGSEANVAVSLSQWGEKTAFVTRVPATDLGRAALSALSRYGVATDRACWGGDRLGLYFLEMGIGPRPTKVVYDRAQSGMATWTPELVDWSVAFQGATWLHWSGITPAISASAAAATLEAVKAAKALGLTVSCDLNYRANLWQYGQQPADIMPELMAYCDVVLGDGDTIQRYFGLSGIDYEAVFEQTLNHFPNLKWLAMTARKAYHASHNAYKGFLHNGTTLFESSWLDVPDILDRIGAGDAFMAGLIFGLKNNYPPQYTVDFATAAATLKHTIAGDFNLAQIDEITALMNGNTGGRVQR